MTVVRKLASYKLVVVDVQWGRWDKGGTLRAGDYIFFYGKETKIINSEQYFLQHRTQIYDPCFHLTWILLYRWEYLYINSDEQDKNIT